MDKLPKHFSIVTDANPRYDVQIKTKTLRQCLELENLVFEVVTGTYDGVSEYAYLVTTKKQALIEKLGELFGQEAVIHHNSGVNNLVYVNGPNINTWLAGTGLDTDTDDVKLADGGDYTERQDGRRFRLKFDA